MKRNPTFRQRSISPILEDAALEWPEDPSPRFLADNETLFEVNANIKSTLTDLLNSDAVRKDDEMRAWVQQRLMDAEQSLKRQRRRRTSTPAIVISPAAEETRRVGE